MWSLLVVGCLDMRCGMAGFKWICLCDNQVHLDSESAVFIKLQSQLFFSLLGLGTLTSTCVLSYKLVKLLVTMSLAEYILIRSSSIIQLETIR